MKRILVVSHSFLANDPRVRRGVQAFLDDGWVVDGLFLDESLRDGDLRTWRVPIARKQGGIARYAFEYGAFFAAMFVWVAWRALIHRPDVVYVNSPPDFFAVAALPAKVFGARIVLDIHDPMPELLNAKGRSSQLAYRMLTWQERVGAKAADSLITVHEPLADLIRTRLVDAEFAIVMNVPDPAGWPELEWSPRSRTLVYAGTIANRYGLDDLIRSLDAVRSDIPRLRLRVVGDGEDLESLRSLVADLDLVDRVDFVGRVPYSEIRSHLDGAWLGVNVPKPDDLGELSFSNKVVEWVNIGLPVLASRTTTMERYFPEGSLLYTTGGDIDAISDSLRHADGLPESEFKRHVEVSRASLAKIAWDVQRASLLDAVSKVATR